MANRYQYIAITNDNVRRKQQYIPTYYPTIPATENDTYILTQYQDRLDLIAYDFYGDSTLWWVIAMANELPGDSLYLEVGTQLRIPADISAVLNEYVEYNRL